MKTFALVLALLTGTVGLRAACVSIQCPADITTNCYSALGAAVTFAPVASSTCEVLFTVQCVPASGSYFPVGTNSVQCAVTDTNGNTARCEFRIIVTNAPPVIICPDAFTINANEKCRGVLPQIPVTVIERCTPSNQLVFSQSPVAGTLLAPGAHTVTVYVSEGNHLDASCTVAVTVVDATPPTLQCPQNLWTYCAPTGAVVSFKVTAKDNCSGDVTVKCNPPSDSFFPVGSTKVTCEGSDAAGNSTNCSFFVNVTGASQPFTFVAGAKDNFALPADPTSKSACLVSAMTGIPTISEFDQNFPGRWLGHSFENLPGGIDSASLRVRMKPKSTAASNDVIRVGLSNCVAGGFSTSFAWSAPVASLPGVGGAWTTNGPVIVTLNLSAMPGSPSALLPLLDINSTHRLDIAIGEDTVVDWMELNITACAFNGAVGGVPYVLHKGRAARGGGGRIDFSSENETPFNIDLHLGKSEGLELGFGDDWPGATNPPISECETPLSSYPFTKIEWKPMDDLLCTVQFIWDINPNFVDVMLTQPTNISPGRAIEVWSKGQMVARYFGTNNITGVVLPPDACLMSMGFGFGEFFMALNEPSDVYIAFADYVNGSKDYPLQGDFIRMFFNVPFTVNNGPVVRFDPNLVVNIEGSDMKVKKLRTRKWKNWIEVLDTEVMSASDGLVIQPTGSDIFGACFDPQPLNGSTSYSEPMTLKPADLLNCQGCGAGTVFTIDGTAAMPTIPASTKSIGKLRCEILTTNPLKLQFSADHSTVGSPTEARMLYYENGGLESATAYSNQVVVVDGEFQDLEFFISNNQALFRINFTNHTGKITVDGTPFTNVYGVTLVPSAPISPHEPPFKFCVVGYQKIPLELSGIAPMSPPPPPAPLTQRVTLRCPTNIVKWSRGEGVRVDFAVEGRSAGSSNVMVTCIPPSGSIFPVGLTYVHCHAVDEHGYSARSRFPVFVYGDEPVIWFERKAGGMLLRWPVDFDNWEVQGCRDLNEGSWKIVGDPTGLDERSRKLDRAVGDPFHFFRLMMP